MATSHLSPSAWTVGDIPKGMHLAQIPPVQHLKFTLCEAEADSISRTRPTSSLLQAGTPFASRGFQGWQWRSGPPRAAPTRPAP